MRISTHVLTTAMITVLALSSCQTQPDKPAVEPPPKVVPPLEGPPIRLGEVSQLPLPDLAVLPNVPINSLFSLADIVSFIPYYAFGGMAGIGILISSKWWMPTVLRYISAFSQGFRR